MTKPGKKTTEPDRAARDKAKAKPAGTNHRNGSEKYILRLFVSGTTPRSTRSILNIRSFCEKHLAGRYKLEVVDIYQQPGLAGQEQIIAAPTLIKKLPLPLRRLVGDLSDSECVLVGLDIKTES